MAVEGPYSLGMAGGASELASFGKTRERLSLPALQSRMKCDPEAYETELQLLIRHFDASLSVFQQHTFLKSASLGGGDPSAAKELGDLTMFLAHVAPFYKKHLSEFPRKLLDLLRSHAHSLPSALRRHITHALILLCNRKMIDLSETLPLFMILQTLEDKELKKLAFSHVVQSIRRMNVKHKNDVRNRALQTILFGLLQEEQEAQAKSALSVLCDLHRRRVWYDERTANAICLACFHKSSRIMIAALSYLLDCDKPAQDSEDEDSGSDEDATNPKSEVTISRELVYKANKKGTPASKKKKKEKLKRVMRSLRRQQRCEEQKQDWSNYSPLQHLKDSQGFAERLFSRLQTCNERFEVKVMMIKVIARNIGLHCSILLNFYPFLQRYVQPHQRDVTQLLAAAVQACHDRVPPDAVEPLLKQLVNQFVHDRARPEVIAVGLNVVREMCLRMPLLMTEDLLRDLALYKKSHEKAVSSAARSLIGIFREICPSLLQKKDRGRGADTSAKPKAYGDKEVACNVPGIELLQDENGLSPSDRSDDEQDEPCSSTQMDSDNTASDEFEEESISDGSNKYSNAESDISLDDHDGSDSCSSEEDEDCDLNEDMDEDKPEESCQEQTEGKKRKLDDSSEKALSCQSLRALKKIAYTKNMSSIGAESHEQGDGILSNEDFQRIKELQAERAARTALAEHGMQKGSSRSKAHSAKIPYSEELYRRQVDPAKLEVNIHSRKTKEERIAIAKAGREGHMKYASRTAVKQKKTGGLSNREKEKKKGMPLAAKRAKVARSHREKRKGRSAKRFIGKKAWK